MAADGTLYPTARYVNAFSKPQVCTSRPDLDATASCADLDGDDEPDVVSNPLLLDPNGTSRSTSLVLVTGIVGVPWQDFRAENDPTGNSYPEGSLHFQSGGTLVANDTWKKVLGTADAAGGVPPTDSLMIESTAPRTGSDGETPSQPLAPPDDGYEANPVNGHEWRNPAGVDPQYACIFPLPHPRDCAALGGGPAPGSGCDCADVVPGDANPLCQDPSGAYTTIQRAAKAYPSLRQLDVLRGLGVQGVPASLCARNLVDTVRQDYGYRPAFDGIVERLQSATHGACLPNAIRPLPAQDDAGDSVSPCSVIEARPNPDGSLRCDPSLGLVDVPSEAVASALAELRSHGVCDVADQAPCATFSLCQLRESDSSCHTDPYAESSPPGWCFVDPDDVSTDDPSLVARCPADQRRVLRVVDPKRELPANGATLLVTCKKSE